jgi:hypothetical protein
MKIGVNSLVSFTVYPTLDYYMYVSLWCVLVCSPTLAKHKVGFMLDGKRQGDDDDMIITNLEKIEIKQSWHINNHLCSIFLHAQENY